MNSSLSQMARARNISANFSSLSFRVNAKDASKHAKK